MNVAHAKMTSVWYSRRRKNDNTSVVLFHPYLGFIEPVTLVTFVLNVVMVPRLFFFLWMVGVWDFKKTAGFIWLRMFVQKCDLPETSLMSNLAFVVFFCFVFCGCIVTIHSCVHARWAVLTLWMFDCREMGLDWAGDQFEYFLFFFCLISTELLSAV